MYHLFFLFYVLFLAFQSPIIAAQTCNSTTGTYQSCCPSSDKKTLTFQGREYRVHCNYTIGSDTPVPANNTDECAQKCKNGSPYWEFYIRQPLGRGVCTCGSLFSKSQTVSFVPIDPELANDLAKCRADNKTCTDTVKDCQTKLGTCSSDLATCKGGLTNCQGQCDQSCPGQLQRCQHDLGKIDKACPGRLSTCNTALQNKDNELQQCKSELKTAKETLSEKTKDCPPGCGDKLKKCNQDKKKIRERPKFKCTAGVRNIEGAKYRVHCNEWQSHFLPEQDEYHKVQGWRECARRCAQSSRCKWLYYTESGGMKQCWMNFDNWYRGRTNSAQGGTLEAFVMEKV